MHAGLFLVAALMAVLTLVGGAVSLPRAWPHLDVRQRGASLGLLAGMVTLTVLGFGVALHGYPLVPGGLFVVFLALFFWAYGTCEWGLPKSKEHDLPGRHERRVDGVVMGTGSVLLGGSELLARLAHAPWMFWFPGLVGVGLFGTLLNRRARAALLRWL